MRAPKTGFGGVKFAVPGVRASSEDDAYSVDAAQMALAKMEALRAVKAKLASVFGDNVSTLEYMTILTEVSAHIFADAVKALCGATQKDIRDDVVAKMLVATFSGYSEEALARLRLSGQKTHPMTAAVFSAIEDLVREILPGDELNRG